MSPEAPGVDGDKIVRKRWKGFAAGGALILCVGVAAFASLVWPSEPKYKGHNLKYWARNYRHPEALLALSTIVTSNPENVVCMLDYDPPRTNRSSPLLRKLPQWVWSNHTLGPIASYFATDQGLERRTIATTTFMLLGTNGAVAVPQLKKLLTSSTSQTVMYEAASLLTRVGPAGKEALLSVATDKQTKARAFAVWGYADTFAWGEPPDAFLKSALEDQDREIRDAATDGFYKRKLRLVGRNSAPDERARATRTN